MNDEQIGFTLKAKDEASGIIKRTTSSFTEMNQGIELLSKSYTVLQESVLKYLKLAGDEERVWNKLETSLSKHGLAVQSTRNYIEAMSKSLEHQSGVADDVIGKAYDRLITANYGVARATDMVKTALNIAAKTGDDFTTILTAMIKGGAESEMMLNRIANSLGIIVPVGQAASVTLKEINDATNGAMADNMKGYAGAVDLLSGQLEDLGKNFVGGSIMRQITNFLAQLSVTIGDRLDDIFAAPLERQGPMLEDYIARMKNYIEVQKASLADNPFFSGTINNRIKEATDNVQLATDALATWYEQMQGSLLTTRISIPPPMLDDYEAGLQDAVRITADYRTEIMADLKQANDDWLKIAADMEAQEFEQDAPDQMRRLQENLNERVSAHDKAMREQQQQVDKYVNFAMNGLHRLSSGLVSVLSGARVSAAEIFKQMALDFIQFFIDAVLEQLARNFVTSFLKAITLFDVPANDALVFKQGVDFGTFFWKGVASTGPSASEFATAAGSRMPAPAYAGAAEVNNHFYGVVAEDFIARDVFPAVSEATRRKQVSLTAYNNRFASSRVFRG